jgi:hypothetical protein
MPFIVNGPNPDPEMAERQNRAARRYWQRHPGIYSNAYDPPSRADSERYPDFFVLGAQKGGTTWLMNQLALHPQLWCPIVKELFYFDELYCRGDSSWAWPARVQQLTSTLKTSNLLPFSRDYIEFAKSFYSDVCRVDDRWYSTNFQRGGADQFVGDAVITFPLLPLAAIGHMRRVSPHAKCIFLLRDPFERAWSHLRMLLPADDLSPETQLRVFAEYRDPIRAMTDYVSIYRRILAGFPKEQILLLDYADINGQPSELLQTVCEFIGVAFEDELFPYQDAVVFKGPDATQDQRVVDAILAVTNPIHEACTLVFPEIVRRWPSRSHKDPTV